MGGGGSFGRIRIRWTCWIFVLRLRLRFRRCFFAYERERMTLYLVDRCSVPGYYYLNKGKSFVLVRLRGHWWGARHCEKHPF